MTLFNPSKLSKLLTKALEGRLMSEYAAEAGVSLTYVSELIRKERINPPQPKTLKKLALAARAGVTYEDLMAASGHMPDFSTLDFPGSSVIGALSPQETISGQLIPIMGAVRCGPGGIAYEEPQGEIAVEPHGGDLFALYCKGQSMVNLGIHEGDIAIIKPQQDLKNGDLAVVVVDDEEGTLKKFYKKDKVIILEAANPDYPTRILSGSDLQGFHVVGKVVETRKRW